MKQSTIIFIVIGVVVAALLLGLTLYFLVFHKSDKGKSDKGKSGGDKAPAPWVCSKSGSNSNLCTSTDGNIVVGMTALGNTGYTSCSNIIDKDSIVVLLDSNGPTTTITISGCALTDLTPNSSQHPSLGYTPGTGGFVPWGGQSQGGIGSSTSPCAVASAPTKNFSYTWSDSTSDNVNIQNKTLVSTIGFVGPSKTVQNVVLKFKTGTIAPNTRTTWSCKEGRKSA